VPWILDPLRGVVRLHLSEEVSVSSDKTIEASLDRLPSFRGRCGVVTIDQIGDLGSSSSKAVQSYLLPMEVGISERAKVPPHTSLPKPRRHIHSSSRSGINKKSKMP
jgi:hypothetical protein